MTELQRPHAPMLSDALRKLQQRERLDVAQPVKPDYAALMEADALQKRRNEAVQHPPRTALAANDVVFVHQPRFHSFYGVVVSVSHEANTVTVRDLWTRRPTAAYAAEDVTLIAHFHGAK